MTAATTGGIGSWATAQRVASRYDPANLVLLFADTLVEEDSLYDFLDKAAAQLGVPITRVCDGRTPFEVFWDSHFLGNSRWAPCSEELKQKPCRQWLEEHADPADTTLYVGLDASPREQRRAPGIRAGWSPWRVEFPLQDEPDLTKDDMIAEAENLGLTPPKAYREGYGHAYPWLRHLSPFSMDGVHLRATALRRFGPATIRRCSGAPDAHCSAVTNVRFCR